MVEFAGYDMPVQYSSILDEHAAVRERAGLFDVSHMGQIHVSGPEAVEASERLVSCKVASLRTGCIRYGLLCNESGGVVDDVTLYRIADDELMFCVNAANIDKDRAWICENAGGAKVEDRSETTGMLALQGPAAPQILENLSGPEVLGIKRFRFARARVAGVEARVSNTGYTGARGYELYFDASAATALFDALLDEGRESGLVPAGLGARDTLRLEAALPLYGHELDDDTSPLAAGLDRFIKLDQGGFIGAEAIARRATAGHPEVLVGFELDGRGVARAGYPVMRDGETVGRVTSGAPSPTLGRSIGLAYVRPDASDEGSVLAVAVRNREIPARVVATPFVKR
jgi:aminomethyltransferase